MMSIQLVSKKNTLKLSVIALMPIVLGGCAGAYEEHQRASARQAEGFMERKTEEFRNAGTTRGELWQKSEQAREYEERLEEHAGSDLDSFLQPTDVQPVACELDDATRDWVVFQMSSERLENTREAEAQHGTREQESTPDVTIISGDCSSGQLEGEFVAVYSYDYTFESPHMSSTTEITGRSEGTMRDGVPDGEWLATNRDTSSFSFTSGPRVIDRHDMVEYDNGQRTGSYVNLARTNDGDVLTVNRILSDRRELGMTWALGKPNTRYFMLDGVMDGYMNFANAMLSGDPNCYRRGIQLSENAYCEGIEGELEALARETSGN